MIYILGLSKWMLIDYDFLIYYIDHHILAVDFERSICCPVVGYSIKVPDPDLFELLIYLAYV